MAIFEDGNSILQKLIFHVLIMKSIFIYFIFSLKIYYKILYRRYYKIKKGIILIFENFFIKIIIHLFINEKI